MRERERERDFLFKWLWGPDDQIRKIETPCPEYPGQWPEYPGVTAGVTFRHIFSNLPLHSCPLKSLLQILIHFIAARVDRIPRETSFLKNLFSEL